VSGPRSITPKKKGSSQGGGGRVRKRVIISHKTRKEESHRKHKTSESTRNSLEGKLLHKKGWRDAFSTTGVEFWGKKTNP